MTENKVVHFEIPAEDPQRAKQFYERSFGWKIRQMPGQEYWGVQTTPTDSEMMPTEPGGINGGITRREPHHDHPVVTVGVPDIEKALESVAKAGGKTIEGKEAVGDMGFTAYFQDSEGNVVGLWEDA